MVTKADAGKPRLRRTSEEIRGLLQAAASTYFAQHGYAGTSTRAIATEAGVSETLLFRHFGSKATLFREALVLPFTSFVDEFGQTWQSVVPEETDEDFFGSVGQIVDRTSLAEAIVTASRHVRLSQLGSGMSATSSASAACVRTE